MGHLFTRARRLGGRYGGAANRCFVVAPSLTGTSGDGSKKYGHSLVVDPWGEVLLDLGAEVSLKTVEIDVKRLAEARAKVDAWASLRTDLFPIA